MDNIGRSWMIVDEQWMIVDNYGYILNSRWVGFIMMDDGWMMSNENLCNHFHHET